MYKGEVIVQGTVKDLIKEVWDIWKKAGKEGGVAKYLDDIVDIAVFVKKISPQLKTLSDEAFF